MPAVRHQVFPVVINNGVLQSAPTEIATTFNPGRVRLVTVTSPGQVTTGIQVAIAHQVILPYVSTNFITSTNQSQNFSFAIEGWPDSGQWSIFGYNTAAAPVTWQVYYEVVEVEPQKYVRPNQLRELLPAAIHKAGSQL